MSQNMRGIKPRKNRVEFRLNDDEFRMLERYAFAVEKPLSTIMRNLVMGFLSGEVGSGAKEREAGRRERKKEETKDLLEGGAATETSSQPA